MAIILKNPAYTFDDLQLVPQYSSIESRFNGDIDLSTQILPNVKLKYPIISANMDTITGKDMVLEMDRLGGLGIHHRYCDIEEQLETFRVLPLVSPKIACIGTGVKQFEQLVHLIKRSPSLAGVLIDVAHGHHKGVIEQIQRIRKAFPDLSIIAGNVATRLAVQMLAEAGANCIKVGVGPGCFAAGTRILMANGFYKNIEDIAVGEHIIGSNGKPTTVKNTMYSGKRLVLSYRHNQFYNKTYCTPDHLHLIGDLSSTSWNTIQSRGYARLLEKQSKTVPKQSKIKWKQLEELNISRAVLLSPKIVEFETPKAFEITLKKRQGGNWRAAPTYIEDCKIIPSYETGYMFGTFLGDGSAKTACVDGSHIGSVHWYIGKNEQRIADQIVKSVYVATGKSATIEECDNSLKVHLCYKPLADYLIGFGKRAEKHLPQELLVNNRAYLCGLYDGLLDSDGSLESYGRESFHNTSPLLTELFSVLCVMINQTWPSITKVSGSAGGLPRVKDENCSVSYLVRLGTLRDKRQTTQYQVVNILEREKTDLIVDTYDIEVDNDDHSFIANNVIVHNSLCTTRLQTGNGVPQLSALLETSQTASNLSSSYHITIIADGGIRYAGDVVKALAAGADAVMIGSLFAGTDETPGEFTSDVHGNQSKMYRGMASFSAQQDWKKAARGIEGEEVKVPAIGPVGNTFNKIIEGVLSGMSYQGVVNLKQLRENAIFRVQTSNGVIEAQPHRKLQ